MALLLTTASHWTIAQTKPPDQATEQMEEAAEQMEEAPSADEFEAPDLYEPGEIGITDSELEEVIVTGSRQNPELILRESEEIGDPCLINPKLPICG